jgi:hypothetical protein
MFDRAQKTELRHPPMTVHMVFNARIGGLAHRLSFLEVPCSVCPALRADRRRLPPWWRDLMAMN